MPDIRENLTAWRVLQSLSQGEGFYGASLEVNLDIPQCSRLIKKLEAALGFPLIDHYSRPARLTSEARALLEPIELMLRSRDKLFELSAHLIPDTPLEFNLGLPGNVPRKHFLDMFERYKSRDCKLTFTILTDQDHEDVLNGRADATYIPYRPPQDGLIIWPINRISTCLFASPQYLKKYGTPLEPRDLANHSVILRAGKNFPPTDRLVNGRNFCSFVYRNIAYKGDVWSGKQALLEGAGISVDFSLAVLKDEILEGKIVPVLLGWHRPSWNMSFVMSKRNLSNTRFLNFCRWFADEESTASRKRTQELEKFIANASPSTD